MRSWIEERMQDTFRRCVGTVNRLCVVSLLALIAGLLPTALWKLTGSGLFAYAAVALFALAVFAIFVGLAAQTINVTLRLVAWSTNKGACFFEPEKPLVEVYAPQIRRAVRLLKRFQPFQTHSSSHQLNTATRNNPHANQHQQPRTHARSHRSHTRPSFTNAGGSDSDDSSGPDGEPPSHRYSVKHSVKSPIPPQNPETPDKKEHPWRRHGSCRMGNGLRFEGRRSA